jgi:hypothetical protein
MDIRRCSKEELDQINERARLWKQRQNEPPPQEMPILEPVSVSAFIEPETAVPT